MADAAKRPEPKLARTDFESMTHEQLVAILASASSEGASHLAGKLTKAAATITSIGDDLMTHVKGLEWQGEDGDTFREWGGQTSSSALRLGQYAEAAGRWMETVSQAVAEAKAAMPARSETTQAQADLAAANSTISASKEPGARNDPEARKLAQTAESQAAAAQQRIEAARAEAVQQMRKLAQTYEYSAQQVNSVTPPTFSPPSAHMDSKQWHSDNEYVAVGATGASGAAAGSSYSASGSSGGTHAAPVQPVSPATGSHVTPVAGSEHIDRSRPAAVEINSTGILPDVSRPVTTALPGPQPGVPRPDASTLQPGVVPPAYTGQVTGVPPRAPSTPRPPAGLGQSTTSGGTARMSRETGIMGGRPISPTSGRPGSIPRGTVIGDSGSPGRAPMGRGFAPGTPGSAGAGQSGVTGGRRLASETGRVVGGRPAQPGRLPRPFTQGGSGLVRPAGAADATHGATTGRPTGTHPARSSTARRDERDTRRPDYLTEEEETWTPNNRRNVPPVVG
ncbi:MULTISPECIES: WXG100 family type VII secretion target [unclassified Streptomyces]|uniref:WXG100 family type VII secretion target n=1 Tax=unclassified Streptomyces TaxID=2593676 RepID=UPI003D727FAB